MARRARVTIDQPGPGDAPTFGGRLPEPEDQSTPDVIIEDLETEATPVPSFADGVRAMRSAAADVLRRRIGGESARYVREVLLECASRIETMEP